MGCETSSLQEQASHQATILRRNNRKADKILPIASDTSHLYENVTKIDKKISAQNEESIVSIISKHFFFSSFSSAEQKELAKQMGTYSCSEGDYVFRQKDVGTLFFIIKKGRVRIEINDKMIKTLEKGETFGELSLIYTAPRSASVVAERDSEFWCLHQSAFKLFTEDLMKRNYKIAKPFLAKVPLFQYLSKNQINYIAYSMNSLKFQPQQNIFKENDDANGFYIIVQGEVTILIPNKKPILLSKGESFGENSFKKNQIRTGTAAAGSSGCTLLSIGREGLEKSLGNQIDQIIEYNILKWALKRSKIFVNITDELIKKLIEVSECKEFDDNEIIFKRGSKVRTLIVCLEGTIEDHEAGSFAYEDLLLEGIQNAQSISYKTNVKKNGKGNVFLLPIKKIETVLNINFFQVLKRQGSIFEKEELIPHKHTKTGRSKKVSEQNLQTCFQQLNLVKKLGEGQFGKVFLVKNRQTNNLYAIKCLRKKDIIELGMECFVISEKETIEQLNHPFIVKFEKSFKDKAFVYLLMQYIDGVDFFDMLREIGICRNEISRFYLACLVLAIEEMHKKSIVYRDLKPENAVIDSKGFLYLTDMGAAKRLSEDSGNRTFTIIGTPHYMAPEIMEGKGYGLESDIWSLGVILYEMVCGKLPFGDDLDDPYLIYKQAKNQPLTYPKFYTSKRGKRLMQKLLKINVNQRAIEDFKEIKDDPYFYEFNWKQLLAKEMRPPVQPKIKSKKETSKEMSFLLYMEPEIKKSKVVEELTWDSIF